MAAQEASFMRSILLGLALVAAGAVLLAQQQALAISGAQFDVISIKPHAYDPAAGGGMRSEPDGTFIMRSTAIGAIIPYASPVPVLLRDIIGLPEWARTETYDIIAKPAPDSHPTRDQRNEMIRNLLIERFKVAGHVEEREQTTFALVVARSDGRLGPQLKKSSAECGAPAGDAARSPQAPPVSRCGMRMGQGMIEVTRMALDRVVNSFAGAAGGRVANRTGLDGPYDFSLRFAPPRLSADASAVPDDAPQFSTALQEQLGLKLVPEKTKVKVFVIDHIERPTPD